MSKQNEQVQYEVDPAVASRIAKNIESGDSLYWASSNGIATVGFDENGNAVITTYDPNPKFQKTKEMQSALLMKRRERIVNPDKTPADHYARMRNEIEKSRKNGLGVVAKVLDERYPEQKNEKALGQ